MNVSHTEKGLSYPGLNSEDADFLARFSEESRKRVIRKIDVSVFAQKGMQRNANGLKLRLIPMLVILYLLAYLDKTNIGSFEEEQN